MILRIDHLVLTVRSIETTCAFYERALGFSRVEKPGRPTALHFGICKLNVHQVDHTFEPKANAPTPGSSDVCFVSDQPLDAVVERLKQQNVTIELGPVERSGALGPMDSLYFRDPDANLIEISHYRQ